MDYQLAPDKSEVFILQGKRGRQRITFMLEGFRFKSLKTLASLLDTIDERKSFGPPTMKVTAKTEKKKVDSLIRIMPNIKGPSSNRRAVLHGAGNTMVVHGAPRIS